MTASALAEPSTHETELPFDSQALPFDPEADLLGDKPPLSDLIPTDESDPTPLTGEDLLDFLAENAHLSENDRIIGAGYYRLIDGKPRLARARYNKAIATAHGYAPAKNERKPREQTGPKGVLKVGPNGLIPVGAAYSRLLNLKPGDFVSVFEDQGVLVIDPTTEEAAAAALADELKAAAAAATAPAADGTASSQAGPDSQGEPVNADGLPPAKAKAKAKGRASA